VWTNGATSVFVPFWELAVNKVDQVRASFILEGKTTNLSCQAAAEYSNDRETWTGLTAFGGSSTDTSWEYGTSYAAPNDDYQFVRYGIQASVTSGTDPMAARVTMRLDIQE
jgi:hypothetical protein